MKQNEALFTDGVSLACTLSGSEQVTRAEEVADLFKQRQQVDGLADSS